MNPGYVVRPKADKDIDDIADDLADRAGLDVGLRFLSLAYETFALVASQPAMGWPCHMQNKQLNTARVFRVAEPFEKYLIFYQPLADRIEILRVLHGAQDIEKRLSADGVF